MIRIFLLYRNTGDKISSFSAIDYTFFFISLKVSCEILNLSLVPLLCGDSSRSSNFNPFLGRSRMYFSEVTFFQFSKTNYAACLQPINFTYWYLIIFLNFSCISLTCSPNFSAGTSACVTVTIVASSRRGFLLKLFFKEKFLKFF